MVIENHNTEVRSRCRTVWDIMRSSKDGEIRLGCLQELLRIGHEVFECQIIGIRTNNRYSVVFISRDDDSFIVHI